MGFSVTVRKTKREQTVDYVLTDHAAKRLKQRGIREEWIAAALSHPGRMMNDPDDESLVHALLAIPDKGFRVLRVIYNETREPVTIVTAFFDDQVKDL